MTDPLIIKAAQKINKHLFPEKLFFGPKHIVLGVNNVCNLHCKMCDVGTQNLETNFAQNLLGAKPLNMPYELLQKIIDQTALFYPKAKIGYAFTEPLVYPFLVESITYATQKNLFTSITTNALTLKSKADALLQAGLSELYISLDGLEETHNYIRGNKKSFQKAIEGIEAISGKPNSPKISIFSVITEWNYKELAEFAHYFKDYPIVHLGFMHQNFTTKQLADKHNALYGDFYHATPSNVAETDFSKIEVEVLAEEISKVNRLKLPFEVSFTPNINGIEALNNYYFQAEMPFGRQCNDMFSNIMIKSDGSAIPAHGRCYNVTMGNIHQQNLKEIWNSAAYGQLRRKLQQAGGLFPACNRCCSAFN